MATTTKAAAKGFTAEEMAAMKERAREMKAAAAGADGLAELQAKIADLPEPDKSMATRIHELVMAAAPDLMPRTYYGMPAYAKDGKVICFFQPKSKFKVRYSTFGFQPEAMLDDGEMWPNAYAVTELTPDVEKRISELVKKAVG